MTDNSTRQTWCGTWQFFAAHEIQVIHHLKKNLMRFCVEIESDNENENENENESWVEFEVR
jgi:hypothetical protein